MPRLVGQGQGEFELLADLPAYLKHRLVLLIAQHWSPRTRFLGEGEPFEGVSFEQIPALAIARHRSPVENGIDGLQIQSDHAVPDRLPMDLSDSTIAPLPAAMNERIPIPPTERRHLPIGAEMFLEQPCRLPVLLLACSDSSWA